MLKRSSVTSVTSIFTNTYQNTLPHRIYVTLYEHVRDTFAILREVLENARSVILYEMINVFFVHEPRKGRAIVDAG